MPKKKLNRPDLILLLISLGLVVFGLLMVYNASVVSAYEDFGDKYYFLKHQSIWAALGFLAAIVVIKVDYHYWQRFVPYFLIITLILLAAVFIPGLGIKAYGAQRWLDFKFFTLQPAELAKLSFIFYLSSLFTKKARLIPFLVVTGLMVVLVMLQRDLGTAVVISLTGLAIFFLSGGPILQIASLIPVGLIALGVLIITSPYRKARFLTFLDPTQDTLGRAYHINQVLIALGSGGLFGLGLGESRQKYEYLPEVTTDSIFAVIGEELGFIGALILITAFLGVIYRGFKIAQKAPDRFGQILAGGVTSWLAVQVFINLASMSSLFPLTGVPLPFISYGGSSLVMVMVGMALLLNISTFSSTSQAHKAR